MPPRQYRPKHAEPGAEQPKQQATPGGAKRACPACLEDITSAEDLVEIEVRKRGKPTGKTIKICKECNRRTAAVLMLIEPEFPDELHIYT